MTEYEDDTEEIGTDEIFDANALIVESDRKPFRFQFGGETFELPPKVDMLAASRMRKGDLDGALRKMLGEEQYERLDDLEEVFDEDVFEGVMDAWARHVGISPGKSRGSGGSSRNTGQRSKRTSRGTTRRR